MAILSGVSSLGVYGCLRGGSPSEAFYWLGAGCGMLSLFPITLIFIVPLNAQLMETEKCISVKGKEKSNHTFLLILLFNLSFYSTQL